MVEITQHSDPTVPFVADIVAQMADAVLVVDRAGLICFGNAALEALLSYPLDELIGRPVETLLPPEEAESHRSSRARYQTAPSVRPMAQALDLQALRRDGTVIPVDVRLAPIGPSHVVATIRDVRDLRQAAAIRAEDMLQAARLADQERTSRLVHDLVLQRLFGIAASLTALTVRVGEFEQSKLVDAIGVLEATIETVRGMVFEGSRSRGLR